MANYFLTQMLVMDMHSYIFSLDSYMIMIHIYDIHVISLASLFDDWLGK